MCPNAAPPGATCTNCVGAPACIPSLGQDYCQRASLALRARRAVSTWLCAHRWAAVPTRRTSAAFFCRMFALTTLRLIRFASLSLFCAARARGNERASAQGPDVAARRQLVGNRAERDATVARKGPQEARICQHVAAQDIQRAIDAKNEGWRLDGAFGAALPLFLRARHRSRHPRCHAGRHGSRQNLGGCLRPAIQGHFGSISQHWYPPSRPATALAWMLQCSSAHCSTRPSPRTTTA